MRSSAIIIMLCAVLSACASTPLQNVTAVNARPVLVTKSANIDIAAKLVEGKLAYEAREYGASFDAYTQILLQDRTHSIAWLGRANAALALGRKDEAFTAFSKINLEGLGESEKQHLLVGLSLLAGDQSEANDQEDRLLNTLAYAYDDIRLWNALGRHYDQSGRWNESTDVYVEALKFGKNRDSIINNLGMSLMYQGRYNEAHDKFKQALKIVPESELYDNNMRMVAALTGNYDKALSGLAPKRAAYILNDAGVIAQTQGDIDTAKKLLSRAIAVSPIYHAKAHANLQQINSQNSKSQHSW